MTSFIAAAASVLLAYMIATSHLPGLASAQMTPSSSPMPDSSTSPQSSVLPESLQSLDSEIRPVAQDIGEPLQNNTTSNITQLATLPSIVNQPIIPASLTPVSAESNDDDSGDDFNDDDSGDDSNDDDSGDDSNDDDSCDDSNDDDSGDDDSGNNDGDG